MSTATWEMRPDDLADDGLHVVRTAPEAASAGDRFLAAVTDGGDAVHHRVLAAALDRYHGTLVPLTAALSDSATAGGTRLTAAAGTGTDADREALRELGPTASAADHVRDRLRRAINVPRR
ncbi:hypothetical protein [Mumia sp. Pv 4-285]|uniref:hypothetical protein n=1 Tax=Mumia qirimensis TaxID=3234852 RepID=UPI00351D388F